MCSFKVVFDIGTSHLSYYTEGTDSRQKSLPLLSRRCVIFTTPIFLKFFFLLLFFVVEIPRESAFREESTRQAAPAFCKRSARQYEMKTLKYLVSRCYGRGLSELKFYSTLDIGRIRLVYEKI